MIRIRELDHLVLRVIDIESMLHFYCDILGCKLEKTQSKFGLYQLRAGSSLIDLIPVDGPLGKAGGAPPGAEGRNLDHFCLRVDPFDASAIIQFLEGQGIECSDVADRYGAEGSGPSLYVTDPEKNVVELKGPPSP